MSSPGNFHDHQLPDFFAAVMRERRLPPDCLELEITETVIMADAVHMRRESWSNGLLDRRGGIKKAKTVPIKRK